MDFKTFTSQMFTPGTVPCTIFGIAVGLVLAILCLTIGVGRALLIGVFCLIGGFVGGVRNKPEFTRRLILHFHRDEDQY